MPIGIDDLLLGALAGFLASNQSSRHEARHKKKKFNNDILKKYPREFENPLKELTSKYASQLQEEDFDVFLEVYNLLTDKGTSAKIAEFGKDTDLPQGLKGFIVNNCPSLNTGVKKLLFDDLVNFAIEIQATNPEIISATTLKTILECHDKLDRQGELIKDIHHVVKDPHPPSSSTWNVPYERNPNFVDPGKDGGPILKELHKLMSGGEQETAVNQKSSVSGMGGVGKTQLAVQYAYYCKNKKYCPGGIYWVQSDSGILEEYGDLAYTLGVLSPRETAETEKLCLGVRDKLNSAQETTLLTLDNLDNPENYKKIKPYLPTNANCRILITTRESNLLQNKKQTLPLDVLNEEKAIELLYKEGDREETRKENQEEKKAAKRVCYLLGYLPLALELAGKYLSERNDLSLAEYANRLENSPALHKSLNAAGCLEHTDHEASVEATLQVNSELLQNNETAKLLALLTCFAPEGINPEFLKKASGLSGEPWEDEIIKLKRYYIIKVQLDNRYKVHRLLQKVLSEQLPQETVTPARERYLDTIMKWSIKDCWDVLKLNIVKAELPHLQQAVLLAKAHNIWPQYYKLARNLGEYYRYVAEHRESIACLEPLEALLEKKQPQKKSRLAAVLQDLGLAWSALGEKKKAIGYYEEGYSIFLEYFGEEHPYTQLVKNNLNLERNR